MNETFKRKLDECYEALSEGKDPGTLGLNAVITTAEELEQCLPAIKEENDAINKGITDCDHRIKTWQESKKAWKERQAVLLEIVETALAAHLKTDDTLLLTMPKSLHYKDSKSVKIS